MKTMKSQGREGLPKQIVKGKMYICNFRTTECQNRVQIKVKHK